MMYLPCFVAPILGVIVGVHQYAGSFCIPAAALRSEKERQGFQLRKFKTAEKNRTNYVYYTAEGKAIRLSPGMTDDDQEVTEEIITLLHTMDDDEVDAERREWYHCPVHYQSYTGGSGEDAEDRNDYLEDVSANPLEQILAEIDEQERSAKIDRLETVISNLTYLQQSTIKKRFFMGMTNVAIATEEGVSEAAIRNRLKKIFEAIKKKF